MKSLIFQNKFPDLKYIVLDFCEYCAYDKQKNVKFSKMGVRVRPKKLELVHTDVWSPTLI